ncbi:amidohydrolase family protein [Steroidobacter flavus]|uniref:Amidohydrolase family protein n=1 Tax=Steroidobacter flavus TaxID=1842136 RepID=A0ABV8T560_9GAMM
MGSPAMLRFVGVAALILGSTAFAAGSWDVTDTGQPYSEAQLTLTEGTWMSVDVSPDGRTLAFDLLGDIYTLPATGGNATLVHSGPAMQRMPAFSADGRRFVYISDASGVDNVWISNIDGSEPHQVTHESVNMLSAPAWGPNDESIVAVKLDAAFPKRNSPEIVQVDLTGGEGRSVVQSVRNGLDVQEPRFSPDGRYLYYTERTNASTFVFVDANHINYAVRRRELATGQTESVVSGFGSATTPEISPDGRQLAFVRRVKEKTVLFVYDVDSAVQRPVYDGLDRDMQASYGQQSAYYPRFSWFPDNRHVAIWGRGKLYRVDTRSGEAAEIPFQATAKHRITNAIRFSHDLAPAQVTARAIRQLAPSPDNKSVVFTALGHLWRKPLPDGKSTRLTSATAFEFEPAWSVDGRQLAYVEWDDDHGSALKILAARGGKARTIISSSGVIREPSFSPDGQWLVYRINAGDKTLGGFRAKPGLYVVPSAGGKPRFVTNADETPRFSADGSRLYYVVNAAQGVRKLMSVNVQGFDEREHVRTPDVDTLDLRLSPDERWIAFRDRQQYYVTRYRETGSPLTVSAKSQAAPVFKLTSTSGASLTWSNDSASLHWTLGPDLYRADVSRLSAGTRADVPKLSTSPVASQPYAKVDVTALADVPQGVVAFTNARVITMRGDEVIERGTVVVERNKIKAVGPADSISVPANAKVIDVSGKTIMPGLVDMHGHTECCNGTGVMPQKQPTRYAQLSFGVTTNFDPYSYNTDLVAYESNETNQAGLTVSPRWIAAGLAIYGRPQMSDSSYVPIESYADAQALMTRKLAQGGTFVKSYRQPARFQRQMLVKAGREAGVMVDVEGEGQFYTMVTALFDGHTGLEHNFPVANYYDDLVQLMKHGTTSNTPTLLVIFGELFGENYLYQTQRAWEDPKVRAFVQEVSSSYSPVLAPSAAPAHVRNMTGVNVADELWDVGFRAVSRSVKKLDDAGVVINAGSHGQVPGLSLHWEMWLLAQGGMSNHRILRTATINGAKTLALEAQIGSLEPGKLADLIVLDANPLDDIHNTNTVRYTMLNGRLYDSLSMNEIGNYDRPRSRFYWEREDYHGIDWNESWSAQ